MSSFCFGAPYHRNLKFPADGLHISMQVVVLQYERDSFKKVLISGVFRLFQSTYLLYFHTSRDNFLESNFPKVCSLESGSLLEDFQSMLALCYLHKSLSCIITPRKKTIDETKPITKRIYPRCLA